MTRWEGGIGRRIVLKGKEIPAFAGVTIKAVAAGMTIKAVAGMTIKAFVGLEIEKIYFYLVKFI